MAKLSAVERRHQELLAALGGISAAIQALGRVPVDVVDGVDEPVVVVPPPPPHPDEPFPGPPPIPMIFSGRVEGATGGQLSATGRGVKVGNVNNPVPVQSDGSFGLYGDKLLVQGMIWAGEPVRFWLDDVTALQVRTPAGLQDSLPFVVGQIGELTLVVR